MIPIPNSRVFRSRRGAIWWSFWVIVAAIGTVGFRDAPSGTGNTSANATARPVDALGQPVDDQDLQRIMTALNTT